MTNNPSETVLSLVASDVEEPVLLATIEALRARLASPPPEGVALDQEEALALLRGMALVSTMAMAERDRYRLAWLSARQRATYYQGLNAVHVEALTDSRRRAANLAQAVIDGTPRKELVELITGNRAPGVRLAVVRDAGREPAMMAIPDDELQTLPALADDESEQP